MTKDISKQIFSIVKGLIFLLIISLISSCSQHKQQEAKNISAPYFGIKYTSTPKLLVPDLIATSADDYNGTFSPDGKEFYYTVDVPGHAFIAYTTMDDQGHWSEPKTASFSGEHIEYDPFYTQDGKRLYFSSRRPLNGKVLSRIWYVEKTKDGWSKANAVKLGSSGEHEYYTSLTKEGNLYFNLWSLGKIFKGSPSDTGYQVTEVLFEGVSKYEMGDPFISPNEDYIIFRGYGEESLGRGDLFISFNIDGKWSKPQNLGEPINTKHNELCPYITNDGKFMIFASSRINESLNIKPNGEVKKAFRDYNNGRNNIYYISANFIEQMRPK